MHFWLALLAPFFAYAQGQAPADAPLGRAIFESQCALCHGEGGVGGRGHSLQRATLLKAPDDAALRRVIEHGIEPEMPASWQLNPGEVGNVVAYVRSLGTVKAEPLPGDAARGTAVYESHGCSGCHISGGAGHGFGPELTAIGARRTAAFLRSIGFGRVNRGPAILDDRLYVAGESGSRLERGFAGGEQSVPVFSAGFGLG